MHFVSVCQLSQCAYAGLEQWKGLWKIRLHCVFNRHMEAREHYFQVHTSWFASARISIFLVLHPEGVHNYVPECTTFNKVMSSVHHSWSAYTFCWHSRWCQLSQCSCAGLGQWKGLWKIGLHQVFTRNMETLEPNFQVQKSWFTSAWIYIFGVLHRL